MPLYCRPYTPSEGALRFHALARGRDGTADLDPADRVGLFPTPAFWYRPVSTEEAKLRTLR
jgi:hypothetical protein